MKKLLSIVLLAVLLYHIGGIFVVFKFQQNAIRKEIKTAIKQGVPKEELHLLTFTAANYQELEWHNHKEFRYRGVMYDIVRKTINHTTSVTFECVSDTDETELFKDLDQLADQEMDERQQTRLFVKLLMLTFYVQTDSCINLEKVAASAPFVSPLVNEGISEKHNLTGSQPPEQRA